MCLSIRWFVPLLAPAYFLIGLWLRQRPQYWMHFGLLSVWGLILMLGMGEGPWSDRMVPGFWLIQVGAFLTWGGVHLNGQRRQNAPVIVDAEQLKSAEACSTVQLQATANSLDYSSADITSSAFGASREVRARPAEGRAGPASFQHEEP
jgi:hypothetical protein